MEGLLSLYKVQGLYSILQNLFQNSWTTVPPPGRIPCHFLCIVLDSTEVSKLLVVCSALPGLLFYPDSRLYMVLFIVLLNSIFYSSPTQLCPVHLPFNDVDCCFRLLPEGLNCAYCVLSKVTAFFFSI